MNYLLLSSNRICVPDEQVNWVLKGFLMTFISTIYIGKYYTL